MTTQLLNVYHPVSSLDELLIVLKAALNDAGDDRVVEGGDPRLDASEIYFAPLRVHLDRERLSDGGAVYNLRLTTVKG